MERELASLIFQKLRRPEMDIKNGSEVNIQEKVRQG